MSKYIYLCVSPEALIASMLPPFEFGAYMATGTKKKTKGQSIFFELDSEKITDLIPWEYVNRRCVIKDDGTPKSSVYLSIYRAMELIPREAFKNLYLTTDDGKVLELRKKDYQFSNEKKDSLFLYQELCPVTPLVASSLAPSQFIETMTNPREQIAIPQIFFVQLKLDELASNPKSGSVENLPYTNIAHLRDCLLNLKIDPSKLKKTVNRHFNGTLLYRTCENGFFVGSGSSFNFYPYPSMAELEENHYDFWRSI